MVKRIHEVDNPRMYTWYIATTRRDAYFACRNHLLPTPTEEYVNVRKYSGVGLQEELVKFYAREYITACNFCDGLTPDSVEIPVAEQ